MSRQQAKDERIMVDVIYDDMTKRLPVSNPSATGSFTITAPDGIWSLRIETKNNETWPIQVIPRLNGVNQGPLSYSRDAKKWEVWAAPGATGSPLSFGYGTPLAEGGGDVIFLNDINTRFGDYNMYKSGKLVCKGGISGVTFAPPTGFRLESVVVSLDGGSMYWLLDNGYGVATTGAEIVNATTGGTNIITYSTSGGSLSAIDITVHYHATFRKV